jgi:glycosyltransferase involved in cell wall biosynthesis
MKISKNNSSLSVVIIAKNEEGVIGQCIKSVSWADEIVVVDANSSDRTASLCKELGAKVFIQKEWLGFGRQKNLALSLASKEWVLSLDADEIVSLQLKEEIQAAIQSSSEKQAFQIPRSSSYCGQFIKHSGWSPDYVLRLFPRENAHFSDDLVHEKVIFDGEVKSLKTPLIHTSFDSLEDVLDKTNRYSSAGALMMHGNGKKCSLSTAVFKGVWAFIRTYFLRLGFLDGRMGFVLAVSNAETTYYKYLKLFLLSKNGRS